MLVFGKGVSFGNSHSSSLVPRFLWIPLQTRAVCRGSKAWPDKAPPPKAHPSMGKLCDKTATPVQWKSRTLEDASAPFLGWAAP